MYNDKQDVFSDYKWLPWKFSSVPNGIWESKENQREYLKWLELELG
jgi:hypothetical protein